MCGISQGRLGDKKVFIRMGRYGGAISIGGIWAYSIDVEVILGTKQKLIDILSKYKKEDIINLIVDLIENAEEG